MISEKNDSFPMVIFNMSDAGFFHCLFNLCINSWKNIFVLLVKFMINVFHYINFK